MKRYTCCCALLLALGAMPLRAQDSLEVFQSITFAREDGSSTAPARTFGFSYDYTDAPDCFTHNECEIPGPPPGGLYPMFVIQPNGDGWLDSDVRGLPDSVGSDGVRQFRLVYEFDVRNTNVQKLIISLPSPLSDGIDSITFTDNITHGSVFNHTFDREGGQVVVPDPGITEMHMTVYYNITPLVSAVPMLATSVEPLGVRPCPARCGGAVDLGTTLSVGATVVVTDVVGRQVSMISATSRGIPVPAVPGIYVVEVIDRGGVVLKRGRVVAIR